MSKGENKKESQVLSHRGHNSGKGERYPISHQQKILTEGFLHGNPSPWDSSVSLLPALAFMSIWSSPGWSLVLQEDAFYKKVLEELIYYHRIKNVVTTTSVADVIGGVRGVIPTSHLAQYGDFRYDLEAEMLYTSDEPHRVATEGYLRTRDSSCADFSGQRRNSDWGKPCDIGADVTNDIREERPLLWEPWDANRRGRGELFLHPIVDRTMDKLTNAKKGRSKVDQAMDEWVQELRNLLCDLRMLAARNKRAAGAWTDKLIDMCTRFLSTVNVNPALCELLHSDMPLIINYDQIFYEPISREEVLAIPQPLLPEDPLEDTDEVRRLWVRISSPEVRLLWLPLHEASMFGQLPNPLTCTLGRSDRVVVVTSFLLKDDVDDDSKNTKVSSSSNKAVVIEEDQAKHYLGSLVDILNKDQLEFLENRTEKFSSRWAHSTPSLRKPSLPKFFFPQAHGYWNRELFPYQLSSPSSSQSSLPGERSLTPDAAIPTQDPTINPIERQQNLSLNDASSIKSQVDTYLLVIQNWLDNYKQQQEQMHSQSSLNHQQQLLTSKFFNSSQQPPLNQFWNPVHQSQENHPPKANPMGREQFSRDEQFTHGHLSQQNPPAVPFPSMDQMSFFARYPPPRLTHRLPTTTSTAIPSHPYYQQHSNAEHQFPPAHQPSTMPPTSSYFHPPIQRSEHNTLSQHPTEKSKFLPQNTFESNLQQRFISGQRYGVSSNWPPSPSELPEGRSYANMKNQFQEQHQIISPTFPSYRNNVPSIPKSNVQEVENFPQVKHSVPENSLDLNLLKNLQRPKGSDEVYYQQFQHPVPTSISKPVPTEFLPKIHPGYPSAQKQTYSQVCNLPPLHSQNKDDSFNHGWKGKSDWFHLKQKPCQQTNALSSFPPGPDTWKLQASENKDQMHSNQHDFLQGLDLHSKCYNQKPEQNQMNRIKPEKFQSMKQNSQAVIDNTSLADRQVWLYPLPLTQEGLTNHYSGSNIKNEPLSAHSAEWPQLPSYDASAGFSQEPVQPVNSTGCCNEEARNIQVLVKNRKKKKGKKEINRYLVGIQRARHEPNKQIHRKKISSQKNGKAKPKLGEYKSPYKKINGHVAQRNSSNHILKVEKNSATKNLQGVLNYKKKSPKNFTNNTYIVDANDSDSYGDTTDPSSSTSEKLLKLFEESISSEKSSDMWLGNSEERVEPELKNANESVRENLGDKYHSWSSGDEANPSNHRSNYKEHNAVDDDSLYASTKVKEEYKDYLRNDSADQVKGMNESKCKKITYHPPYALSSKSSNREHVSPIQSLSTSYNDSFTDIFTKEQMNLIKNKVFNSENSQIMRENSSEDYLNRNEKENYDLHSVDGYSTHDLQQNQDSVEQSRSTSGSILSLTISSPSCSFLYSRDDDDKTSCPITQSLIVASSYLEDYRSDLSTKKDFVTSTPVKHSTENVHSGAKRKLSEIKSDDFEDIINPLMKRLRQEMDKKCNAEQEANRSRENGCSQKIPVTPNYNTGWCNSIKSALITIVRDVLCSLISEPSENDLGISAKALSKYMSTTDRSSKRSCSNSFVLKNSNQMDRGNDSTVSSKNASIKNSLLENRTLTRRHGNGLFGKTNCCRTDKSKPMDAGKEVKLNDASCGENGTKNLKLRPHCRSRHSMVNASGPNGNGLRGGWQNVNNGIKEHSLVNLPEQRTYQTTCKQHKNFTRNSKFNIIKGFRSCSLSDNIAKKRPRNNKLCAMMSNLHMNPYFRKPQFTEMKKKCYPLPHTNSCSSSMELKPFGSPMIISGSSSSLYTPDKSSSDDSYYTAPISPMYC